MVALTEESLNKLSKPDLVSIINELQNKINSLNHELPDEMKHMKQSFADKMRQMKKVMIY